MAMPTPNGAVLNPWVRSTPPQNPTLSVWSWPIGRSSSVSRQRPRLDGAKDGKSRDQAFSQVLLRSLLRVRHKVVY